MGYSSCNWYKSDSLFLYIILILGNLALLLWLISNMLGQSSFLYLFTVVLSDDGL